MSEPTKPAPLFFGGYKPKMACEACIFGRGDHSDDCPNRPSECLKRIDVLLMEGND